MKSAIINTVGVLGGYHLARLVTASQPKILMYHRFSVESQAHCVSAKVFEKQVKTIKKYFNPMTLAEIAEYRQKNGKFPKHAVAITVDDGYRDFYEVAYPILKRYHVPATFYVTTGFVDQRVWLWPDQVTWILDNKSPRATSIEINGCLLDLKQEKKKVWWPIVNGMLSIENALRVKTLVDLALACEVEIPQQVPEKYAAVSWQQLKEMQSNGIEIGGHTVTHPSLGHMTIAEAEQEIMQSLSDIEQHLGVAPRTFCYPNGQPSDYSVDLKAVLASSKYLAAVTAYSDMYNADIPYAWRRFVGSEESFQFNKSLFGVEHLGNLARSTKRCDY